MGSCKFKQLIEVNWNKNKFKWASHTLSWTWKPNSQKQKTGTCPWKLVDSPPLEMLKARLDGALNNVIKWVASLPVAVGGGNMFYVWGPSSPDHSMILWFHASFLCWCTLCDIIHCKWWLIVCRDILKTPRWKLIICWNNKKKKKRISRSLCLLKCDINVSKPDLVLLQKQNDFWHVWITQKGRLWTLHNLLDCNKMLEIPKAF